MSTSVNAKTYDVAVIGAGMVGACCASWLRRSGHSVALIDRGEPGGGASYGNAGVFATYASVPLNSPTLPGRLPKLLFAKESPLTVDWGYVLRMTPWLLQFLANCRPSRVAHISQSLASLVVQAEAGALPLFQASGADKLMQSRGAIYLYETEAGLAAAQAEREMREHAGFKVEAVTRDEIGQLEPNLAKDHVGGFYYPDSHNYTNPQASVGALAQRFAADGGDIVTADISSIARAADGALELRTCDTTLRCRQMVLAAGAFSRNLFGGLVEHLPLETERGFHVVFEGREDLVSRPVGHAAGGFYMTPMEGGLRAAGTVELGRLKHDIRDANIRQIMTHARRLLPQLPKEPDEKWVGHRPTMPDSLPVIGRSQRTPEIIFAFGHQHVGMTLGGITGKLVAEIVDGAEPSVDLEPFAPGRF